MDKSYYKKPHREKLTDAFMKTFGQIYSQYSAGERVDYWINVFMGFSIIAYLGLRKQNHPDSASALEHIGCIKEKIKEP